MPKSGVIAGVYVTAISAFAPHPAAAKLWMEHLYSDEGQIGWLKGYCHPIRFQDLVKNNKAPADVLAKLPAAESYANAKFPTLAEQAAAKEVIAKQWDAIVAFASRRLVPPFSGGRGASALNGFRDMSTVDLR